MYFIITVFDVGNVFLHVNCQSSFTLCMHMKIKLYVRSTDGSLLSACSAVHGRSWNVSPTETGDLTGFNYA